MLQFNKIYFSPALLLFLILVFIAGFVEDSIIRPYGGDFLVVIFLYCLLKSFFRISVEKALFGVLLFSFAIEGLQYFNILKLLELENNKMASVVLGNHFELLDLLLYSLGALTAYLVEQVRGECKN